MEEESERAVTHSCIVVPKRYGEPVRRILLEHERLDQRYRPQVFDERIAFPLALERTKGRGEPLDDPLSRLLTDGTDGDWAVEQCTLEPYPRREKSYRDALRGTLDEGRYSQLPRAFDIIGTVAIIKLPEVLRGVRGKIGAAIMQVSPNITSVLEDRGVTGEYRIRDLVHIAGEEETTTVHTEYGTELWVDPQRVYFSPRLAAERHRIATRVAPGETVLDMFAGAGPYTIAIALMQPNCEVYAIDINPDAVALLRKNIAHHGLENVIAIEGDAHETIRKARVPRADRIVMNLPHSAATFIDDAITALGDEGVVHYYEFIDAAVRDSRQNELRRRFERSGWTVITLRSIVVHTYSPTAVLVGWDVTMRASGAGGEST